MVFCLFPDSCTEILIPLVQNYCQKVLETKNDEEMLTVSKNIGKLCYGLSSKILLLGFSKTFLLLHVFFKGTSHLDDA